MLHLIFDVENPAPSLCKGEGWDGGVQAHRFVITPILAFPLAGGRDA